MSKQISDYSTGVGVGRYEFRKQNKESGTDHGRAHHLGHSDHLKEHSSQENRSFRVV